MAYEIEIIKNSQEIFYYLLKYHELREENEERLYRLYVENEELQALVKGQGEAADAKIERYGDAIYLIPNEDNYYLGFSKTQLKTLLCRSGATDRDFYLSQFVILTLLVEFYDGQGSTSRTRDYIRVGELQNRISERLSEGVDRMSEEDEIREGIAFSDMQTAFEALKSDETGRKTKTTKEGFLHNILLFLQRQGLIDYVERDETIVPTAKLDRFMDWNVLNENNYERVAKVLKELKGTGENNGNDQ